MPAEPIALKRPPIRQATLVRRDVAHTFDSFVTTIAQWWPLRPLSAGKDRVVDVVFERELGGRLFEVWDDGTTVDWGELLVWEPPRRFVLTWRMTPVPTEIELRFKALGSALTRSRSSTAAGRRCPTSRWRPIARCPAADTRAVPTPVAGP